MYGIPGFAQGGIIGSVWDGVKDASSWVVDKAEDVGKWIGDKFEAIVDWIAHPVKHVTDLVEKSISGLVNLAPVKAFGQLGEGIFKHAYSGIGAWIKKELKKIEDSMANPGGSGVQRWKPYVIRALKAMDLMPRHTKLLHGCELSSENQMVILRQLTCGIATLKPAYLQWGLYKPLGQRSMHISSPATMMFITDMTICLPVFAT
jgi:hypothetical protein